MSFTATSLFDLLYEMMLPMLRILMMLTVAPIFGTVLVSIRIRVGLAFALSILLSSVVPTELIQLETSGAGFSFIAVEVVAGMIMGFLFRLVFGVLELASQIVALQMGLGFGAMIDPQNNLQGPTLSQLYMTVGTLVFLALDGHLMLIAIAAESFHRLPMGTTLDLLEMRSVAGFASAMYTGAVLVAFPATAALLTVNITVGVLTRAVPQFNMFIAFPGVLMLGLLAISFTLPGLIPHFSETLSAAVDLASNLLQAH